MRFQAPVSSREVLTWVGTPAICGWLGTYLGQIGPDLLVSSHPVSERIESFVLVFILLLTISILLWNLISAVVARIAWLIDSPWLRSAVLRFGTLWTRRLLVGITSSGLSLGTGLLYASADAYPEVPAPTETHNSAETNRSAENPSVPDDLGWAANNNDVPAGANLPLPAADDFPEPNVVLPVTEIDMAVSYLVRPGDCLWSIAQAHLPDSATVAQISAATQTWYLQNQETIGLNPDLIRPGETLFFKGDLV